MMNGPFQQLLKEGQEVVDLVLVMGGRVCLWIFRYFEFFTDVNSLVRFTAGEGREGVERVSQLMDQFAPQFRLMCRSVSFQSVDDDVMM